MVAFAGQMSVSFVEGTPFWVVQEEAEESLHSVSELWINPHVEPTRIGAFRPKGEQAQLNASCLPKSLR